MTTATTTATRSALSVRHVFALLFTAVLALVRGVSASLKGLLWVGVVMVVGGVGGMVFGYEVTPVVTNSMEPVIVTGNYVVTRPYVEGDLSEGTILSYRHERGDRVISVTHRVIAVKNGQATMKGDRNEAADEFTIGAEDVLGVVAVNLDGAAVRFSLGAFLAAAVLVGMLSPVKRFLAWSAKRLG
ncbi:S26 family signal peptidase [Microbacterium sp. SORGH_AS_0888]|uniref:S26 family signal peptidase n=1 Tax=Microbacterium sp. SORGH_AS_0888 TaxID=3041791 RepID=UPI00277E3A95|nr:S26 family signal peptidase [Microbacterium sp. SORGH_AS_0888]MDQ1130917.1 signal peptidase I [Microbacterium sp. SORGH_AS_0888]